MQFGEFLKKRRLELSITVEDLAKMVGISRATLYRYENGERQPRRDIIEKLANALDTTPAFLLGDLSSQAHVPAGSIMSDVERHSFDLWIACSDEKDILFYYRMLNKRGRIIATERLKELTELPKYTNPDVDNEEP